MSSGNSYRVPKAGVITSWSFKDGSATLPALKLKVGRHVAGDNYTIVAEAAAGSQTANAVNTYRAHIPVQAGDLIGIYTSGGLCGRPTGNSSDRDVFVITDAAPGFTGPFSVEHTFRYPVAAKVALDCVVPNLKGKTLKAAKKALKANSCTLGKVNGPKTGTVKSQKPAVGKTVKPGAKVNVRLG